MKPNTKKMSRKISITLSTVLILGIFLMLNSCSNTAKEPDNKETQKTVYPSDIISFSNHWNLILGDGSNAGYAKNFEH